MSFTADVADDADAGYSGGNQVRLLAGGAQLFPAMQAALAAARREVWLATYIFHDDATAQAMATALREAGARGVRVHVVVDGFGSKASCPTLRQWLPAPQVALQVFRPLGHWWSLLQPGQLRRLHQKLCVVDGELAFVGGINIVDDCNDIHHGWQARPRLDFAVQLRGPVVADVAQAVQALFKRAALGAGAMDELLHLARSAAPLAQARQLWRSLRLVARPAPAPAPHLGAAPLAPVRAALRVRDNLRQRRSIERAYVQAIGSATRRVHLVSPYFYPGQGFRRALCAAARRGVEVRLLLQGQPDYRLAALAARVLYAELQGAGVRIHEYTPAFLHAKVALVDDDWATVGSSNIDPLSLLLNLEANVLVRDAAFSAELSRHFDAALAQGREAAAPPQQGAAATVQRGLVAWLAHWALRVAGITGRY